MTRLDAAPRSVHALVWCLAALHFRSGRKFSGATYEALHRILGTSSRSGLRRTMRLAEELAFVSVEYSVRDPRTGSRLGAVRLSKSALRLVESTLGDL